jgi:hypothetical protein
LKKREHEGGDKKHARSKQRGKHDEMNEWQAYRQKETTIKDVKSRRTW